MNKCSNGEGSWRDLFQGLDPNSTQTREPTTINERGDLAGGQDDMPLDTNKGYEYPEDMISDLTYNNYAFNRDEAPHITPKAWEDIYGPTTMAMEQRYQRETNDES